MLSSVHGDRPDGQPIERVDARPSVGSVSFVRWDDGEVTRELTVDGVPDHLTAEVLHGLVSAGIEGSLPIDWIERDQDRARFGSRRVSVDSLADHVGRHGRLPPEEAIPLLLRVGSTLRRCHYASIRHGSLSLASVTFDDQGVPLLADVAVVDALGRSSDEASDVRDLAALVSDAIDLSVPDADAADPDGADPLVAAAGRAALAGVLDEARVSAAPDLDHLLQTLDDVGHGRPVSPTPPVEPVPAETAPVEPAPVEPAPVEPAPVEPAPVEPVPVEPVPVEPVPVEPVPVEPVPVEPVPVEPAPVEPAPTLLAPIETAPTLLAPPTVAPPLSEPVQEPVPMAEPLPLPIPERVDGDAAWLPPRSEPDPVADGAAVAVPVGSLAVTTPAPAATGRRAARIGVLAVAAILIVAGLVWVTGGQSSDSSDASDDGSTVATSQPGDSASSTATEPTTEPSTGPASTTTSSPSTSSTLPPVPSVEVVFSPLTIADGVVAERSWRVVDDTFVGEVTVTNSKPIAIGLVYDELIPAEFGVALSDVVFEPADGQPLTERVQRFGAKVEPGATFVVSYTIPVAPLPDQPLLDLWSEAWGLQYQLHLDDPAVSPRDTDSDGYVDLMDFCPTEFGGLGGCLDADLDGAADNAGDECPGVSGPVRGCPDEDGDGVMDSMDDCQGVQGRPGRADGCPDRDGDGVIDRNDRCVDVPGNGSADGCPAPVIRVSVSGRSDPLGGCTYSYTATVQGFTPASYSWSASSASVVGSSGSTATVLFENRGVAYSATVSVTVTGSGQTRSGSTTVNVQAASC